MRVPLVGREPEIAVADHLLASAREGSGGGVLLVGEAGIGKTRLMIEIADHARAAGFTVLTGRSAPGGGTYRALTEAVLEHLRNGISLDDPSLRPYRAALGRLVPGWAGQGPPAATPELADPMLVLGEGLLRLLTVAGAAAAGCLLVLEDLHWADPDTVTIVGYLADAARHSSIMIAATAWDDQPGAPRSIRPVDSVVGTLNRHDGMVTVWLDRLDEAGTAALATAHTAGRPIDGEALAALIDHADGLPLLVEDLLPAALADLTTRAPMPRTMTDLVGRRMAELDPDARRVLQAAAVLGEQPDWSLVGSTARLDAAAVSTGLRAGAGNGLLVPRGTQLVWRHNLTRAAVLAGLVPTERSVLVDRVADLLLARGGDADEALAADLLTQAGESARATAILLRLAGRDIDRGALHAAKELLGQAASLGAPAAQLAIDRARLLTLLGRAGEALDGGIPVLDELSGNDHAGLCLQLAGAAIAAGRWDQAQQLVDRAGRPGDPLSLVLEAEASFGSGDLGRATTTARAAVEAAEHADAPDLLCAALVIAGRCASFASNELDAADYERAAQCAAEHGLVTWRVEALFGLGLAELSDGRPTRSLTQARELALDLGLLSKVVSIDVITTEQLMTVAGPAAAEPQARRTSEDAHQLGLTGLAALADLAVAAARAAVGDAEGMSAALATAAAQPDVSLEATALVPAVRAWPYLLSHDLPRANAYLDESMTTLAAHGSAAPVAYWGPWVVLRTVLADRDEEARTFLRTAGVGKLSHHRAALAYADAVVAGRAGDSDLARDRMAEGDRLVGDRPWWGRLLRLLALESAVLEGWGDPIPTLRTELVVHREQGDERFARVCRDLLRRAGAETRRGRGDSPVPAQLRSQGVTSREMDVLQLVAQGLSNAEVAGRLYLSPRTVDTHVASLLAKTGTHRRGELRELMAGLQDR